MNPQDIIEKANKGELSEEEIEKLDKELTDEQKAEISKKAATGFKETLTQLNSLRKEKNRVQTLADEAAEKKRLADEEEEKKKEEERKAEEARQNAEKSQIDKLREENIEKAKTRLLADHPEAEALLSDIEATFNKLDSGKMDADNIYLDLVRAFGAVNSPALIEAKKKQTEMEKQAAIDAANGAGSHESGKPGEGKGDEVPKPVKELSEKAGITTEAAKKVLTEGMTRTY